MSGTKEYLMDRASNDVLKDKGQGRKECASKEDESKMMRRMYTERDLKYVLFHR